MITDIEREQLKREIISELQESKGFTPWRKFMQESFNPMITRMLEKVPHIDKGYINAEVYKMRTAINSLVKIGVGISVNSIRKDTDLEKAKKIAHAVLDSWEGAVK